GGDAAPLPDVVVAGVEREVVRVVVVHLDHQALGGGVARDGEEVVRVVDVGVEALHDQVALGVVATGGAHGVDEGLVEAVLYRVVLDGGRAVVAGDHHLVGAREQQVVVVVLEVVGDLGPELGDARVHRRLAGVSGLHPAAIPVDVDDGVEAGVARVVHDLGHAGHPGGADVVVGVGVLLPRHGDADGLEARGLHGVHDRLVGGRVAPGRLTADGLQRVAEV